MTSKTNFSGWSGNTVESSLWQVLSGRLNDLEQQLVLLRTDLYEAVNILKNKDQEIEVLCNKIKAAEQRKESRGNGSSHSPKISALSKDIEPEETVEKLLLQSDCVTLAKKIQEMEAFFSDYGLMWIREDALQEADPNNLWVRKTNIHYTPNFDKIFMVVEDLNLANAEPQIVKRGNSAQFKSVDLLNLTLYADGMQLESNPFRPYESPSVKNFFADLEDGYFPTELKGRHPEGVIFKVQDKRSMNFAEDSHHRRFIGNGEKVGGQISSPKIAQSDSINTSNKKREKKMSVADSIKSGNDEQNLLEVYSTKDWMKGNIISDQLKTNKIQDTLKANSGKGVKVVSDNGGPNVDDQSQMDGGLVRSTEDSGQHRLNDNSVSDVNKVGRKRSTRNSSNLPKKLNSFRRRSISKKNQVKNHIQSDLVENNLTPKVATLESNRIVTKEEVALDSQIKPHSAQINEIEMRKPSNEPSNANESGLKQLFSASSPHKSVERVPKDMLDIRRSFSSAMIEWPRLAVPPASPSNSNMTNSREERLTHNRFNQQQPFSSVVTQTGSSLKNIAPCSHACPPSNVTNFTYNEAPITIQMTPNELLQDNLPIKSDNSTRPDSSSSTPAKSKKEPGLNVIRIPGETEYRDKYNESAANNVRQLLATDDFKEIVSPEKPGVVTSETENSNFKASKEERRYDKVDTTTNWENFTYLGHPKGQEPERTRLSSASKASKQKTITTVLNEKTSDKMITVRMRTSSGDKEFIAHVFPEDPVDKLWSLLQMNGKENNLITADTSHLVKRGSIGKNSNGNDLTLVISKTGSSEKSGELKSDIFNVKTKIKTKEGISKEIRKNVGASSKELVQLLSPADATDKTKVNSAPPLIESSSTTLSGDKASKSPLNSLSGSRMKSSLDKVELNKSLPVKTISNKRISQTTASSTLSSKRTHKRSGSNLSAKKSRSNSSSMPLTPKKRGDSLAQHLSSSSLYRTSYKRMSYQQLEAISEKDELLIGNEEVSKVSAPETKLNEESNITSNKNSKLDSQIEKELASLSHSVNETTGLEQPTPSSKSSNMKSPITSNDNDQLLSNSWNNVANVHQQLEKNTVQPLPTSLSLSPISNQSIKQDVTGEISGKSTSPKSSLQTNINASANNSVNKLFSNNTIARRNLTESAVNLRSNRRCSNGKVNSKKFDLRNSPPLPVNSISGPLTIEPRKLNVRRISEPLIQKIQIRRPSVGTRNTNFRNVQRASIEKITPQHITVPGSLKQVQQNGKKLFSQKLSVEIGRFILKSGTGPPNHFKAITPSVKTPANSKFQTGHAVLPKPVLIKSLSTTNSSRKSSELTMRKLSLDVTKVNTTIPNSRAPNNSYHSQSLGNSKSISRGISKPKIAMPYKLSTGLTRSNFINSTIRAMEGSLHNVGSNKNNASYRESVSTQKKGLITNSRGRTQDKPKVVTSRHTSKRSCTSSKVQNDRQVQSSQQSLPIRRHKWILKAKCDEPQRKKTSVSEKHELSKEHPHDRHRLEPSGVKFHFAKHFDESIQDDTLKSDLSLLDHISQSISYDRNKTEAKQFSEQNLFNLNARLELADEKLPKTLPNGDATSKETRKSHESHDIFELKQRGTIGSVLHENSRNMCGNSSFKMENTSSYEALKEDLRGLVESEYTELLESKIKRVSSQAGDIGLYSGSLILKNSPSLVPEKGLMTEVKRITERPKLSKLKAHTLKLRIAESRRNRQNSIKGCNLESIGGSSTSSSKRADTNFKVNEKKMSNKGLTYRSVPSKSPVSSKSTKNVNSNTQKSDERRINTKLCGKRRACNFDLNVRIGSTL